MDLSYRTCRAPVSAWRAPRRERLTLGVACSLNWGPLRDLIDRPRRLQVELVVEDFDGLGPAEPHLGRGVDLVVALHESGPPGWRSTPLWSEPLTAFMAKDHPLAKCGGVSMGALRETPILMAGTGAGDRALQRAVIAVLCGPPNFLHYAVRREEMIDLTALGFGITLAGASARRAFPADVCARPLESAAAWLSYCAFWPPDAERPALRGFLKAVRGGEAGGA